MVYELDGCSIEQVARRFFNHSSSSGRGPITACHARIAKLVGRGLLDRRRLAAWSGIGSGRYLLRLGPHGRTLLAEALELPRSELKRSREILNPYVAAHHLAAVDFRLDLLLACRRSPLVSLTSWITERELRKPPITKVVDPIASTATRAEKIPLIADGAFTLTLRDGRSQQYLLEMDLGTVPEPRVRLKLRGYLVNAARDDRPILWVVPRKRRLEAIASWIEEEAARLGADPSIFWLATSPALGAEAILAPVWSAVGVSHPVGLVPKEGAAIAAIAPPGPAPIDFRRSLSTFYQARLLE